MDATKSALIFWLFLCINTLHGQQVKIGGTVSCGASNEKLIGALITDASKGKATVANEYGYFAMAAKFGDTLKLSVSFVGYTTSFYEIVANTDTMLNIRMMPTPLTGVTVVGEKYLEKGNISTINFIAPANIEMPKLMADLDILNLVKYVSGVQPGLEGAIGFSVRGGNTDHNLIVMDNIPLYNTGHLANFMSIFDPFAINSMTFYKGGFPAQFGGRLSSVMDIYMREGNAKQYHGEFNIGMLSTKLALEGPIIKDKASFLISLRRSTTDLLLQGLYAFTKPEEKFLYGFDDLNVKINLKGNDRNHFYLSFYHGSDKLQSDSRRLFPASDTILRTYSAASLTGWGNNALSFRWNRMIGKSVFYNNTLAISDFSYYISSVDQVKDNARITTNNTLRYSVEVKDIVNKHDFDILINQNLEINSGLHFTHHNFTPVDWHQFKGQYGVIPYEISNGNFVKLTATEVFAYWQAHYTSTNDRLVVSPGMRLGRYILSSSDGFNLLEPRLALKYKLDSDQAFDLNYDKMSQTVHSLNTSGTALTPDVWIPATMWLGPAISHQLSASHHRRWYKVGVDIKSGIFYKWMHGLIEFNSTGFAITKGEWDRQVESHGTGKAYGFEMAATKKFEHISIESNYTFSRAFRRFADLNNGQFYPQNFDRPHNFTITSAIKLNEKISLSALWTYHSGQPISLGYVQYPAINNHFFINELQPSLLREGYLVYPNHQRATPEVENFERVLIVDEVNNFRMPNYHRLDLGATFRKNWKNGWRREFTVAVYNAYNRMNAYYIYANKENGQLKFHKLTMFPILPTCSYALKF